VQRGESELDEDCASNGDWGAEARYAFDERSESKGD
jgi:hypothetical protein